MSTLGTFTNPKHWKLGDKVTKGDIYQVQVGDSPSETIGDYYRARRDFTADYKHFYPWQNTSDANWFWLGSKDLWYGVKNVAVQTSDGRDEKYIYTNGLNMLRIDVYMTPFNPAGEQITVDLETLINSTYLINYSNGDYLIWKGENAPDINNVPNDKGWMYSTGFNQFTDVPMNNQFADVPINNNFIDREAPDREGFPGSTIVSFYVFAQNLDASTNLQGFYVSTTIIPENNPDNKFIGKKGGAGLALPAVQMIGQTPVKYDVSKVSFDREDTAGGWHWDQDNYYLTITEPGYWLEAVSYTPGLQIGPDSWWFTKVWDSTRNWGYIWPFSPQPTYSEADVPVDDPLNVNFKYNDKPNAQCFTRIAIWDRDMVNDYNGGRNALYDTHFTIFDQYGNHGKFTAVKTEHGNRITLRGGWMSSDG